jgi:hypothetical protein
MIGFQWAKEVLKTLPAINEILIIGEHQMPALRHSGGPAAPVGRLRLPDAGFDIMCLEERYGQEGNVFQPVNIFRDYPQLRQKPFVQQVIFRLISEDSQRNTEEAVIVYFVYLRYKTFKSIQALSILTWTKIKDESSQFVIICVFGAALELF